MIVVIDYDVGNVKSVCNAFASIGCKSVLSSKADDIIRADGLVLPGVAAFGYAVGALGGLAGPIKQQAEEGKPLLGICVGFQMLFDRSFEYGRHNGLGLIAGDVVALPATGVVPHMGWNLVRSAEVMDLFLGLDRPRYFYFAHSYYANIRDKNVSIAYTDYGFELPAAVQKGRIFGTQFHPEKSGPVGLKVLENFAKIAKKQ